MRLAVVLLAACSYIARPDVDPADPVTFSLINTTTETLYLSLDDGETPLGASVRVMQGDGVELAPRQGCRVSCSDGCGIETCATTPGVRPLAPGEALLVEWNGNRYDDGSLTCGNEELACVVGQRAGRARYQAVVCYARSFAPARQEAIVRRPDGTLSPAVLADVTCLDPFGFNYPSYDVRYQVELR